MLESFPSKVARIQLSNNILVVDSKHLSCYQHAADGIHTADVADKESCVLDHISTGLSALRAKTPPECCSISIVEMKVLQILDYGNVQRLGELAVGRLRARLGGEGGFTMMISAIIF